MLDARCRILDIRHLVPAPKRKENSIMKAQTWIEQCKMLVKWKSIVVVTLLFAMLVAVTSCAVTPRRRRGRAIAVVKPTGAVDVVYVQKAPPKPRSEVRSKRPGPKAVWVGGHWDRNPRGNAWIQGHWEKKPRGWAWVPGHWK